MQTLQAQAIQFRQAYGVTNDPANTTTQLTLIAEEYEEFREALRTQGKEAVLKELADLVYVCYQFAENLEWDLDTAMVRVHESNMSKLGPDGHPIRRADGKVLKGPNYKPPVLSDLVDVNF